MREDTAAGQARRDTGRNYVPNKPTIREDAGKVLTSVLGNPPNIQATVLATLQANSRSEMGRAEIIEKTGLQPQQVGEALKRLQRTGQVFCGSQGWTVRQERQASNRSDQSTEDNDNTMRETGLKALKAMPVLMEQPKDTARNDAAIPGPDAVSRIHGELDALKAALNRRIEDRSEKMALLASLAETLGGELGRMLMLICDDLERLGGSE